MSQRVFSTGSRPAQCWFEPVGRGFHSAWHTHSSSIHNRVTIYFTWPVEFKFRGKGATLPLPTLSLPHHLLLLFDYQLTERQCRTCCRICQLALSTTHEVAQRLGQMERSSQRQDICRDIAALFSFGVMFDQECNMPEAIKISATTVFFSSDTRFILDF